MSDNKRNRYHDTKKIGGYKNNRVVVDIFDKIVINKPGEGPLISPDSKIGLQIGNYANGTGENFYSVRSNISLDEALIIINEAKIRRATYELPGGDKIFGEPNEKGLSIVTKTKIARQGKMPDGNIKKLPWYIGIQNGFGVKKKAKTGGFYLDGRSFVKDKEAFFNLSDEEIFSLFIGVQRRVDEYIAAYAAIHVEERNKLLEESGTNQREAYQSPVQKNSPAPNVQQEAASNVNQNNSSKPKQEQSQSSQQKTNKATKRLEFKFISSLANDDEKENVMFSEIETREGKTGLIYFEKEKIAAREKEFVKAMETGSFITIEFTLIDKQVFFVA
ncbi:hypothetical protein M2146_001080 [Lachnospiraceae bacterium PF1-22]